MKYWEIEYETASREVLTEIQLKRLQTMVNYAYHKIEFYRKKMDDMGISPSDIKQLSDIQKLPFTTKDDLRDNYPDKLFAVPNKELVRIHASSGTTGKPTVVAYTKEDVELWSNVMGRTLYGGGANSADVVQVAYGYGLFTGGLGLHYGAEKIGATVIPISGGNTQKQLMLMQDLKSTVICCTPSYAIFMAEEAPKFGFDVKKLGIKVGFFGAEPWSDQMRDQIEEKWGIKALDIYGLSEIIGPGVAFECLEQNGLHINEDHFYPEIIDPQTLKPVAAGTQGELVFTTFTKKGLPLIRYRTKDLTHLMTEKCGCGRTLVRMKRVTGRSDDMMIIRGVNVFPSQIEEVLLSIEGTEPHYLIVLDREKSLDTVEIQVEVSEKIFTDEIRQLEDFQAEVKRKIEAVIGISAKVKLVAPKTIERSMGKSKRVQDNRKI